VRSQFRLRNNHRLVGQDQDRKVLERSKKLSKSSASNTRPKVLDDLNTWTLVEFCDLIHLAKNVPEYHDPDEIVHDIESGGPAAGLLDKMRQQGFGGILKQVVEFVVERRERVSTGPERWFGKLDQTLNAATVYAILQVRRALKTFVEWPPRQEIVRKSKRRTDTKDQRRHIHFQLAVPGLWLVPIFVLHYTHFRAAQDGRLQVIDEHYPSYPAQLIERLYELLDGAYVTRFRRCAYRKCRRLFYARRDDQLCCTPRCNNDRWQLKSYASHGKSAKE
jgi:hypothetical protein